LDKDTLLVVKMLDLTAACPGGFSNWTLHVTNYCVKCIVCSWKYL